MNPITTLWWTEDIKRVAVGKVKWTKKAPQATPKKKTAAGLTAQAILTDG